MGAAGCDGPAGRRTGVPSGAPVTSTHGEPEFYPLVVTGSLLAVIPLVVAFVSLQRHWKAGPDRRERRVAPRVPPWPPAGLPQVTTEESDFHHAPRH